MSAIFITKEALPEAILAAPFLGRRRIVCLSGPPASGKSTLAEELVFALRARGQTSVVVPMDGFHLDNAVLTQRGLLPRKGAPETFDSAGLLRLLPALRADDDVYFPLFDRDRDISIAGAGVIDAECDTVIVEGNYLLFDHPDWRVMAKFWDLSIKLDVPLEILERRLFERWNDFGFSQSKAQAKVRDNDLVNARLVTENALPADLILKTI